MYSRYVETYFDKTVYLNIEPSFQGDDLVDKVVRINYYIRFIFMIAIYLMLNI